MKDRISEEIISEIVNTVPDEWLTWEYEELNPRQIKDEYTRILTGRLDNSEIFLNQAIKAHDGLV